MGRMVVIKKVMSMCAQKHDHWLHWKTYDEWISLYLCPCLFGTEFCMWHLWQFLYNWNQYYGNILKFWTPLKKETKYKHFLFQILYTVYRNCFYFTRISNVEAGNYKKIYHIMFGCNQPELIVGSSYLRIQSPPHIVFTFPTCLQTYAFTCGKFGVLFSPSLFT